MIIRRTVDIQSSLGEIKTASNDGYLLSIMSFGDGIVLPHKLYGNVEFLLADYYDHTAYFVSKRVMFYARMNDTNIITGGFPVAKITNDLGVFGSGFSEDVFDLIKIRHIEQVVDGETFECYAPFWLPSVVEVFGEDMLRCEVEDDVGPFHLFEDEHNRTRINKWWLRSPNKCNYENFMIACADGALFDCEASAALGVVPCFCI